MSDEINKEKFIEWLNETWKGSKNCPICFSNNWSIGNRAAEIRLPEKDPQRGRSIAGGPFYPMMVVICGTCGYTLFFNAVTSGFWDVEKNEPKTPG